MPRVVSIAIVAIAAILGASGGGWLADFVYMQFFAPPGCNDVITPDGTPLLMCLMPSTPWWSLLCGVFLGGVISGAAATWILRALPRHATTADG